MANKTNKTMPTNQDVASFIARLDSDEQRRDSQVLVDMMTRISGKPAVMWGGSIIGFDTYHYKYASGHEGDCAKIGFSPRKGKLSLYITVNASKYINELDAMGKYSIGKGCIYIKKLADIDIKKLEIVVRKAYQAEGFS